MSSININTGGGYKKNKNILPEVNKRVSLRKQGYTLDKSDSTRRHSLKRASKKYGTLPVLRRVNLIRNYSKKNKKKYNTLSKDVEYMKATYKHEKLTGKVNLPPRKSKRSRKSKKSKNSKK